MTAILPKSAKSFTSLIPKISVMDRYIISELIPPFLFGVGMFASLGLTIGTVFELIRRVTESGLPLNIALQILLLKMPYFIVLAFPMSMVLSTLMVYSRMSSDSEVVALRSAGVTIFRLVIPALIFSLIVTGLTFLFNEKIVPSANYQATITLNKALKREKAAFQESNIFYPEYRETVTDDGKKVQTLNRLFYAEQFDGKQMKGLTVLDKSQPQFSQIIVSDSAIWNAVQNSWDFFNGTVYLVNPDGSYRNIVKFDHQKLELPRTPLDLAARGRDYDEMNIAEAKEYLQIVQLSGDQDKIRKLKVRIAQKYALPFVCIVFTLVGASLGTRPQKTGRFTSFGISIVIIFCYYLMIIIAGAMGQKAILTPFLAAWLPPFIGLFVGSLLLIRNSK
jgi:lipopolysaccharide export system permease protein